MPHGKEQAAWEELFGAIGRWFDGLLDRIAVSIETIFNTLANNIGPIITRLTDILVNVGNKLEQVIGDIYGKISEFVETTVSQISVFVEKLLADVISSVTNLVSSAESYIKDLSSGLLDYLTSFIGDAAEYMRSLFDEIKAAVVSIVDNVSTLFNDVFDKVVTKLEEIVNTVQLFLTDLFNIVKDGVTQILNTANQIVTQLKDGIADFIAAVVDNIGGSLRELLDTISDLPAEISELARRLIESAETNIANPISNLPSSIIDKLIGGVTGDTAEDNNRILDQLLTMLFGSSPVNRSPETMRSMVKALMPAHPMSKFIITTILSPLWILQTLGGIASANSQILLQEHAYENPYKLIEIEDIRRAWYRQLLETQDATDELRRHGYTESAAEIMLAVTETIAPEQNQLDWWLRGFTSEGELGDNLSALGYGVKSISLLKQGAMLLPPVQDLITMAVREVFSPAIADKFGQFEDYPPEFTEHAAKLGLSEEWAVNYWAAHWKLPSVNMGFEMLHRRIISVDELNMLLRSADVMPFWRDKLVAMSYSPLTRVDIRRMHKLGVLNESEVLSAYQDIGYDKANAKRLLDFTIQLNGPTEAQDERDLSSLTKSNIISFYKDGILQKQEAETLLIESGMSKTAATLFLDNADYEIELKSRKAQIDIILDRADTGVITFEQAQDDLNRLGLETNEILIAITELNKREARRTKLPSRSDLDKMIKAGILSKNDYLDTLNRLGYSNWWADKYLKLAQG